MGVVGRAWLLGIIQAVGKGAVVGGGWRRQKAVMTIDCKRSWRLNWFDCW